MPISVTCPGCHSRFNVSDKFAGQTGPCPKCKQPIRVPAKSEEVVIHAPEEFGPKDATGRAVLKPMERQETAASPVAIAGIAAAVLATVVVAFVVGRMYANSPTGVPAWLLGFGAALLGPPIAVGAYGLMRDTELEPHRGPALWLRSLVCGLIYAALWGVFAVAQTQLFDGQVEIFHLVFIAPVLIVAGGVTSMASLELDFTSGAIHYGIYLLVTCLLRLVMGVGLPVKFG
jgi:hypothetical protein